jgi:hypothetical protein
MAATTVYPSPAPGTDKHRAVAFIEVTARKINADGTDGGADETRRFYAYTRVTSTGSVDIRENTNPGSSIAGGQVMREDTPTFDVEINIPFDPDQAKDAIQFLRAGKILKSFDIKNFASDGTPVGVYKDGYLTKYGNYIIERSTIDISRDDFTTVRATIRGLGYTRANNLPPVALPV